ncbi:MAG: ribbon-helix-helix protein, CopG family [Proteobacteria bacterium]|nr:ribbon-helix-helix protein, CopG family [Pseudomonadota bacterium]
MAITVRVDKKLEHDLEIAAQSEGMTKSSFIRRCLEEYIHKRRDESNPWERGKSLFGRYGSGKGNLSVDRKKIIREKIHEKQKPH